MKSFFVKFIKIALIVVAVFLAILLVFALALLLRWPWWMGFFLLLGLIGLGVGFFFLRKIWLRRREQQFVQQVIEQDEAHLKTLTSKERENLKEIQDRWKEAVETLRRSQLRKYGNPLYVLPWYLVIGESGVGKTTAISSARLSSPFVEMRRTSGISGTRNCDWWFFEQAIILDTAGRWAIPIDEGRDKEEWQRFLSLLIKYRKKEPIHGLIVAISADKLLEGFPEALEEEGRNIRRRIDELMRVLETKFPIYLLVTKCDRVQGMTQFCDHLPEKSLDQPMGVINQNLSKDVPAFLEQAFNTVGERLRNLRILLLHNESKRIDPSLLLFPEEFENLKKGLSAFMKGAFRESHYQQADTPILRGLFFSSGLQEGSPYSHFLNALGLIGEKETLPGTNKGLFLHDFFGKILPKDRGLLAPTKRALQWQALTRNLGLTSWVILGIAVVGLLTFSFVKNLNTINEARDAFSKPFILIGESQRDMETMDRFCQAILRVERQNRNWWVPRFGLNESIHVENGLKKKYCKQFQEGFLTFFDKQMASSMAQLHPATPDEVFVQYVIHLVRRIHLLKARLEGESFESLRKKPQPSYGTFVGFPDQGSAAGVKDTFGSLYLYYLVWRFDTGEINKEIDVLQAWLKDLLIQKRTNLYWLVTWANREGTIPPITLRDFWRGSLSVPGENIIVPAFTQRGRLKIDSFMDEIRLSLSDPKVFTHRQLDFEKWYQRVCLDSWEKFGAAFSRGEESLKSQEEWQQIAAKMPTDQGPYFGVLNRMAIELEMVIKGENIPPWLKKVYQFQLWKVQGPTTGIVSKALETAKKVIGVEAAEDQLKAAKAYQDYANALNGITPASASRAQAHQMASQVFTDDPATSKSPFFAAQWALTRLKNSMKGGPGEEVFWKLINGPLVYLWSFVRVEAACQLQIVWEQTVLSELKESTPLPSGKEGPIWKFIKGPGDPFIGWGIQKGYYPKEVLGGAIPFENSFLSFLRWSNIVEDLKKKKDYAVLIKGVPTDANPDAMRKPHKTHLELKCLGGTPQILDNYHYPCRNTFQWSLETCSDVTLQIEIQDIGVLTKKYTGNLAFPEFLQDFKGGKHQFIPNDFPEKMADFDKFGLKFITVKYEFAGDHSFIAQLADFPKRAPRNIVRCWGQ
jgi:type VI secretion system protein ImpL